MVIPENKKETLNNIVSDVKGIDNIAAIVLGGSYSRGMANENSDLDIGIYYHENAPFDIQRIKNIAQKYNIDETLTVTDFYQWGHWVNGGAWINTKSGEVDFVYRNIQQVKSTIEKCKDGIFENDFEQQPPYGFSSVIYLSETNYCVPLYDPDRIIQELKMEVNNYPVKLKRALVQQSLWSAEFTIWQADKFAGKSDIYNTAGCLSRAMKNIVDTLFALNEIYPMGDKKSIEILERAAKRPDGLREKVETILTIKRSTLTTNTKELRKLFEETVSLTDGTYQPSFNL